MEKKFLVFFSVTTIVLLSLLMSFVVAVDPYDKLGYNVFGFKFKAVAKTRDIKYMRLENSNKAYKAFVLGSSHALLMRTQKIKELTGLEAFNYATHEGRIEDYLAITRHILSKHKPKLFIFSLYPDELDEARILDTRLFNSPLRWYFYEEAPSEELKYDFGYFTLQALIDSFHVVHINYSLDVRYIHTEDGDMIDLRPGEKEKHPKKPAIDVIRDSFNKEKPKKVCLKKVEYLKKIADLCKKNNIDTVVYITPVVYKKLVRETEEKFKFIAEIRVALKDVFGGGIDFYNDSMKAYKEDKYFIDPVHPTIEFSDILLERLLTNQHLDLGVEF